MGLKSKHIELLEILQHENNWVTAGFLSRKMNVSVRSIKNYISEINQYKSNIIESCSQGYRVINENARTLLADNSMLFPQTPQERVYYIIKKLIVSREEVNIYDLSDEIYVSSATIKSDLMKVKRKLNDFDIFLKSSNDNLVLEGTEKNKRKLMSAVLYEESNENFLNISAIQDAFPQLDAAYIKESVIKIFNKYHYFINDYSLYNLVIHIAISLDRILNNHIISVDAKNKIDMNQRDFELISEVVNTLEEGFHVKYSETEKYELYLLLMSKVTALDYKNIHSINLKELIGEECLRIVNRIITSLNDYYYIDLSEQEFSKQDFLVRFSLHIKNLLVRSKNNYFCKNPLTKTIKSTYPFIYDVAVFISNIIKEELDIIINDDEISYIALHIGAILEEQKSLNNKVSCIILCPSYYDMNIKIIDKIKNHFYDSLVITHVITSEDELSTDIKSDIILSTVSLKKLKEKSFVFITPFVNDVDIKNILNEIANVKQQKKNKALRDNLTTLFLPDLFQKNKAYRDEVDVIESISKIMHHGNYVDSNFASEVLEREKMSSTAFNNIAIPHTMKMNALHTSAYVLINEKPIKWGDNNVHIVLMLAINKNEKRAFKDIFESITSILSEEENIKKIINCNTYDEFINVIISCL
jgi:lichenan operon transcriptional antiterminator